MLPNGNRIGVAHCDSAHVDATLDFEKSLVTPISAPRVLDNPVVHAALQINTVSNSQNGVVNTLLSVTASVRSVNSRSIGEEIIDDLESNRDGTDTVDGISELNFIAGSHVVSAVPDI